MEDRFSGWRKPSLSPLNIFKWTKQAEWFLPRSISNGSFYLFETNHRQPFDSERIGLSMSRRILPKNFFAVSLSGYLYPKKDLTFDRMGITNIYCFAADN